MSIILFSRSAVTSNAKKKHSMLKGYPGQRQAYYNFIRLNKIVVRSMLINHVSALTEVNWETSLTEKAESVYVCLLIGQCVTESYTIHIKHDEWLPINYNLCNKLLLSTTTFLSHSTLTRSLVFCVFLMFNTSVFNQYMKWNFFSC